MSYDRIEEPQPPVTKWLDSTNPATFAMISNGEALVQFETPFGLRFVQTPFASIPTVIEALQAIYADNLPAEIPPEETPVDGS